MTACAAPPHRASDKILQLAIAADIFPACAHAQHEIRSATRSVAIDPVRVVAIVAAPGAIAPAVIPCLLYDGAEVSHTCTEPLQ
jgi:hypothetical protein